MKNSKIIENIEIRYEIYEYIFFMIFISFMEDNYMIKKL
jgi:hypothetical protein